jgi:hypothetical protein
MSSGYSGFTLSAISTHLLVQGQAIRTTLELLRRKDWTTMIYAHLLNSRPLGVGSPVGLV